MGVYEKTSVYQKVAFSPEKSSLHMSRTLRKEFLARVSASLRWTMYSLNYALEWKRCWLKRKNWAEIDKKNQAAPEGKKHKCKKKSQTGRGIRRQYRKHMIKHTCLHLFVTTPGIGNSKFGCEPFLGRRACLSLSSYSLIATSNRA